MKLLIKRGRIIDPANNIDFLGDMLVTDGIITETSKRILCTAEKEIDASGCIVVPGFVDLHTHLRDPGFTYKETILTGSKAAAKGGFTTICAMPNTNPVADSPEIVRYIINEAEKAGITNVLPVGSITAGQEGKKLSQIREMVKAGAVAISEDGKTVSNAALLKEAMLIARELGIPVFSHCEDISLVNGGVINKGTKSDEYGLPGISNESEDVIIARDIALSRETGAALHICHVSTEGGVSLVRNAKARGENVTAEACPHHFVLSDNDIKQNDGNYKMNPPLRSKKDEDALIKGLADGTIEVIATDHAPHHKSEKTGGFEHSTFGIVGLETAFSLAYTYLCRTGHLQLSDLIKKLTVNPAKVLGIQKGSLSIGSGCDAVIIRLDKEFAVETEKFESMGKNSPFNGYRLYGAIEHTICGGTVRSF